MPKKYALIAIFVLLATAFSASAQKPLASIWVQSVSSGGGFYSNGVLNISYNIGDPIFYGDSSENKFGDFYIFQGFEQPDRFDNVIVDPGLVGDYNIKYGPNPFKDEFHIYIDTVGGSIGIDQENFTLTIVDVLGQKMIVNGVEGKVFGENDRQDIKIDLGVLKADQVYYISIDGVKTGFRKTIKVVKIDNN